MSKSSNFVLEEIRKNWKKKTTVVSKDKTAFMYHSGVIINSMSCSICEVL